MPNKWVYLFNEVDQAEKYVGGEWEKVRGLLGGKGANLAEMATMGLSVPPGFTITCQACMEYYNSTPPAFPAGLAEEIAELAWSGLRGISRH